LRKRYTLTVPGWKIIVFFDDPDDAATPGRALVAAARPQLSKKQTRA
jgi:hypothetical protein